MRMALWQELGRNPDWQQNVGTPDQTSCHHRNLVSQSLPHPPVLCMRQAFECFIEEADSEGWRRRGYVPIKSKAP